MDGLFRYILREIGLCGIPHYIKDGIFYLDGDWYLDDDKYIEYDLICGDIGLDYRIHNCTGLESLMFYFRPDSAERWYMGSTRYVWDDIIGYQSSE